VKPLFDCVLQCLRSSREHSPFSCAWLSLTIPKLRNEGGRPGAYTSWPMTEDRAAPTLPELKAMLNKFEKKSIQRD
jgi:hypothetical protein